MFKVILTFGFIVEACRGQVATGAIGGMNKVVDCSVITGENFFICKQVANTKIEKPIKKEFELVTPPQMKAAELIKEKNIPSKEGFLEKAFKELNASVADNSTITHHPSIKQLFDNSTLNGTETFNGTLHNETTVETTIRPTTHKRITTTTTPIPTTTVDIGLVFQQLGIATEEWEPTTPKPNNTFEGFNISIPQLNETEELAVVGDSFPEDRKSNLSVTLYPEFLQLIKSTRGKPSLVTFDRVKLKDCAFEPHPVERLIYWMEKAQVIGEYLNHQCEVDYHENCKNIWKDCKADGEKLCPLACNKTNCAATKFFGYSFQDKPTFSKLPCLDSQQYNCKYLKDRGDCFSSAGSIVEPCADTCHFCKTDTDYLPWMPEYQKMLIWLRNYEDGKYIKFARVIDYLEDERHEKAKHGLC